MSDSREQPWSDNPNAPKIPHYVYIEEKCKFAEVVISSVLYGTMIVVFFRSMVALFNPVHRRPGEYIKWGLVSYTAAMFSLATVQTALSLDIQSISYIDNREFPGVKDLQIPPGPFGYQWFISPDVINIVPSVVFALSNWLADGLLLYRCYVVYCKNFWVIAFPCLMYLGSMVIGTIFVYQTTELTTSEWSGVPYLSISLSLNVILTVMIVIRLLLHARSIRSAMGGSGSGGLCKAIVTMFIESCALFALNSLLVLVLMGIRSGGLIIFLPILPETQAITSLFVIHRIANKSALTSNTLVPGRISTLKVESRGESTGGSGNVPGGDPASPVGECGVSTGELGVEAETTADPHREEVY